MGSVRANSFFCTGGFSRLSVVGARSVLAEEVFVQQVGLHGLRVREKAQGLTGELDQVLEHDGIMDCVIHGFTPYEWAVAGDENAGAMQRIATGKGFDDDVAGIDFVIIPDFASIQAARAGDRTMKIIGVGRAESRDGAATL